ncbi:hypothetical protein B0J13DRAFT_651651 [Dactylonectria estremocensis]|uniref:Uncharacterized protein n=1 Tax=Dactylonectria estremocensis TaxID=1079267 RepID=A0A9P9IGK1_9HYPO|nr:hypothetical protein B0J13DRAFT_651651 [Dactylonectria estremocensis]
MQAARLCLDALADLQEIQRQAQTYLANIFQGRDMFDHKGGKEGSTRWTPRLQYTEYYQAMSKSLSKLVTFSAAIELQQGKQQDMAYDAWMTQISVQAHITLEQQINLATVPGCGLDAAGSQIAQYTPALKTMRQTVQSQVAALPNFDGPFNWNPSDIINGISQVPANPNEFTAGLGLFSWLYTANTTVEASDGTDVNKDYVMTANGQISVDDPGAAKLLADEQTLEDLVDKFSSALGSSKVTQIKATLDACASLAKRHNAAVLQYNATAVMLINNPHGRPAPGLAHTVPAQDAQRLRGTIYELLYDADRSMQFWFLSSDNFDNPPQPKDDFSDVTLIQSYLDTMNSQFTLWLNEFTTNPGYFFPSPNDLSVGGIPYPLQAETVTGLKSNAIADQTSSTGLKEYKITFRVPYPTSKSNSTLGDPNFNPFVNHTDVRLDQVLVWLFGATVQPDQNTQESVLSVEICHLGDDAITNDDGTQTLIFQHSATQLTFAYDPTNVTTWAVAKTTARNTMQSLDSGSSGAGKDPSQTAKNLSVAPIGPFATWALVVRERENNGLDLSKLTGICLEFWGSAHVGGPA